MTFFTGTGRHRVQIAHFFRGQNGSWRSLEVGLVVGSRLHRIRRRCGSLVLFESPGSKTCPYLPNDLRNRRNLARGGYSSSPVPDLQGQARLRHSFREFLFRGWRRALNLQKLLCLLRDFGQECLKRRRMRCRRLRTSTTYPKRTPGDLRAANRQDSIDAAVMAGQSISRIKKIIFFAPQ